MKRGSYLIICFISIFLMLMLPNVNAVYHHNEKSISLIEKNLPIHTNDIPPWLEKLLEFLFTFFSSDIIDLYFSRCVYVDDDAPAAWYDYMHVKTIQEGINHARFAWANTIRVYDGEYNEQIIMKSGFPFLYARFGFWLIGNSSSTTIINADGRDYGVDLQFTAGWSRIIGFTITNASKSAINIGRSQWNFIYENTIINNNLGIKNEGGKFSPIWKNNFIQNEINAYDTNNNDWSFDEWENLPKTGNYWDDYDGNDNDGDGFGDTPYHIMGGNSKDNHPLIKPWEE